MLPRMVEMITCIVTPRIMPDSLPARVNMRSVRMPRRIVEVAIRLNMRRTMERSRTMRRSMTATTLVPTTPTWMLRQCRERKNKNCCQ